MVGTFSSSVTVRFRHGSFVLAALAATLPAAAFLSACGGSDTKKQPADKWVTNVCDLAATYKKTTDAEGDKLSNIDPDKDAKGAKDTLLSAFSSVEDARAEFSKGLDKAGEPDLKSGSEVVKTFKAHDETSKKKLDDTKKAIEKLDPNSKTFTADLGKILDSLEEADFKAELQKVADKEDDAQEIIDGISKNSDCADVLFSGSDDSTSAVTPTPKASGTAKANSTPKASATAKSSATAKARTTVKPNASVNEKWVVGLCVATQSYVDDIEALSNSINVNNTNDTAKLKQIMVQFLDDAAARSDQFKKDVDRLPTPDVKDGRKIQAAMSDAAGNVATLFGNAADDARKLDAKDPQKLAAGLTTLGENLDTASTDVEDAFSKIDTDYDTTELSKIANQVPECAGFFK